MKHLILTLYALSILFSVIGQTSPKSNTLYVEVGGNALFTAINYERQLFKNKSINVHIGMGIYGVRPTYLTIPVGLIYLFKINSSTAYIDLGFGTTYSVADVKLYATVDYKNQNFVNTHYWNYIPAIGYRKLTTRNLMYRFSLAPVINHNNFMPFIGFSLGRSF